MFSKELSNEDVGRTILELERGALERWIRGDPDGFVEISAPEIVYFDPFRERRVDGLPALKQIYEDLRGKVFAARFEFLDPLVQHIGNAAVLTFNLVSYSAADQELRWNCTEVYRREHDDVKTWRIIQSHWSYDWPPPRGYGQNESK